MIFPKHRIIEQLKKQADLTQEEATAVARLMASQAQGVIAPEDFSVLGHRLVRGGSTFNAGGVGVFNQCGVGNFRTDPSLVVVEKIYCDAVAHLYINTPLNLYGTTAAYFMDQQLSFPFWGLSPETTKILTLQSAVIVGNFSGMLIAGENNVRIVFREIAQGAQGLGIVAVAAVANVASKFAFEVREVDLRVR